MGSGSGISGDSDNRVTASSGVNNPFIRRQHVIDSFYLALYQAFGFSLSSHFSLSSSRLSTAYVTLTLHPDHQSNINHTSHLPIKAISIMTENTNPGNFANRSKEEVKEIASKGGKTSHGGTSNKQVRTQLVLTNIATSLLTLVFIGQCCRWRHWRV